MHVLPLMSLRSDPTRTRRGLHSTIALLAVIALIAVIDYASGMAVAISVLYFIPIIASGWLLRPGRAAAVAVVATLAWLVADVAWRGSTEPDAVRI